MRAHGAASSSSPGVVVNADVAGAQADRFDAARGTADVKWRTDELMALLRGSASQNKNREIAIDDF